MSADGRDDPPAGRDDNGDAAAQQGSPVAHFEVE